MPRKKTYLGILLVDMVGVGSQPEMDMQVGEDSQGEVAAQAELGMEPAAEVHKSVAGSVVAALLTLLGWLLSKGT